MLSSKVISLALAGIVAGSITFNINKATTSLNTYNQAIVSQIQTIEGYKGLVYSLKDEVEISHNKLRETEGLYNSLLSEKAGLESQLQEANTTIKNLQDQLEQAGDIEEVRKVVAQKEKEIVELKKRVKELEGIIDGLNKQIAQLNETIKNHVCEGADVSGYVNEINNLKETNSNLQSQVNNLADTNKNITGENTNLKNENKQLKDNIANLNKELDKEKAENKIIKALVQALRDEIEKLKGQQANSNTVQE